MPSGYNLQGIIRRNTVNALTQFERMGFYSENISNWSTNAYKATRFEEILGEKGNLTLHLMARGLFPLHHLQAKFITQETVPFALEKMAF